MGYVWQENVLALLQLQLEIYCLHLQNHTRNKHLGKFC